MTCGHRPGQFRPLASCLLLVAAVVALVLGLAAPPAITTGAAQRLDPGVRDRVVPATVQVAIDVTWVEGSYRSPAPIPLGSGTIVSPDGLILTNAHVVERSAIARTVREFEAAAREYAPKVVLDFASDHFLVLTSDGMRPPEPAYRATVEEYDAAIDLAILRIVADQEGDPLDANLSLPFVPLGDADELRLGDPIHVFGYPASGGDALTYTQGVVSGFNFEDGIDGPAWINTDAVMSGGNSGGAAVNDAGELIGVPTQGSRLDCRPGDTNLDGKITAEDVGCIPTGGSIGQLRPVTLASGLLAGAGRTVATGPTPSPRSSPAPTSEMDDPGPDLASAALTPGDVREAGLGNFAVAAGDLTDDMAAISTALIWSVGTPGQSWLEDAGASRLYWSYLIPAGTRDLGVEADVLVGAQVIEFPDSEAARGFVARVSSGGNWMPAPSSSPLGPDARVGQQPERLLGGRKRAFPLVVFPEARFGVVVFAQGEPDRFAPSDGLLDLASSQQARLRGVASGMRPSTALSNMPVRFEGESEVAGSDFYLFRDGQAETWYLQTPDITSAWDAYWQGAGVDAVYQYDRIITPQGGADPQVYVSARIMSFASSSDAAQWMWTSSGSRAWPNWESVIERNDAPRFGDASRIFTYVDPVNAKPWLPQGWISLVRVEDRIAEVTIYANRPISARGVNRILLVQTARLRETRSPLRVVLPDVLLEPAAAATATAMPIATPRPTSTPAIPDSGFTDDMLGSEVIADEASGSIALANGRLRVSVLEPGGTRVAAWKGGVAPGRGVSWKAEVASYDGRGEIILELTAERDDAQWDFAVDPVSRTWSLYRQSIYSGDLFVWVEPRSFAQAVSGTVETIEVRVMQGRPKLLINGVDVGTQFNIEMPDISGNLDVGLGAGVNPAKNGHGPTFTVEFERATLAAIP